METYSLSYTSLLTSSKLITLCSNNKVLNNGKYSLIKKDSTRVDIPVGSNGDYLFVGKGPGSSNAAGVGYNSGSHNVHAFYSPGGTVGVSYTFKFGGGGKKQKCKGGQPGQPGTDESNPRPATGQPGME